MELLESIGKFEPRIKLRCSGFIHGWIHIICSSNGVTSQESDNIGGSETSGIGHTGEYDIHIIWEYD
jgi:hypothetical protein